MPTARRYTAIAIVLHWAIAVAILLNLSLGWWMHAAIEDPAATQRLIRAVQLHKSLGFTILALTVIRIGWRIGHPPPPLPRDMPIWERFAANAAHSLFYGLMAVVPLSGWVLVSAQWSAAGPLHVPTLYFGAIEIPHLFDATHVSRTTRVAIFETGRQWHEALAWSMAALVCLHVAAAAKHHWVDRDDVLRNMAPALARLRWPRSGVQWRRALTLSAGGLAILGGCAALAPTLLQVAGLSGTARAVAVENAGSRVAEQATQAAPITSPEAPGGAGTQPAAWKVDARRSVVGFAGQSVGAPFRGAISEWRADIRFDPQDLQGSKVAVTLQMATASSGDGQRDEFLHQTDWLDSANHPTARFRTTRIRHLGDNRYAADGELTLKGRIDAVILPFDVQIVGDKAIVTGRLTLDRLKAGIGVMSDGDAAYVSRDIDIEIHVQAERL